MRTEASGIPSRTLSTKFWLFCMTQLLGDERFALWASTSGGCGGDGQSGLTSMNSAPGVTWPQGP